MNENLGKKNKILIIIIIGLVLLVAGITYAYFSLAVRGNDTSSKNVVKSGDLEITIDGSSAMVTDILEPGDTMTKTWTVKNTGTLNNESYSIYFSELINTYTNNELVYTISCSASSGSCNGVSQTPVGTDYSTAIVTNSIAAGVTQTYTLTVTFIETSSNQNYNKGQTFSFYIKVNETFKAPASDYMIANYKSLEITKLDHVSTAQQQYSVTDYRYQGAGTFHMCQGITTMTEAICDDLGGEYNSEGYCYYNSQYLWSGETLDETTCEGNGGTYETHYEPDNYVTFNGETWRIIGVFEVENAQGVKENKLKLIRTTSIGSYSWDTSPVGSNNGYGYSDWSNADIMKLINPGYEAESIGGSLYYDQSSGTCFTGSSNSSSSCNFTTSGINSTARNMIDSVKYYTSGTNLVSSIQSIYDAERSLSKYGTNATSWIGKVGLPYASDLFYSGVCSGDTYPSTSAYCLEASWLKAAVNIYSGATMNHAVDSINVMRVLTTSGGTVYNTFPIYPTVYLKSNVYISGGAGTSASPYTLAIPS